MPPSNLARVRRICLALPQATEVEAWGSPTFRIGKIFVMYAEANNHHGEGREGVWLKTDHFTQDLLVRAQPTRYFVPPYVGPGGWTGVYLNRETDWIALADLIRDSYRSVAPRKVAALLADDDGPAVKPARPRPARAARKATRNPSAKRAKKSAARSRRK